MIIGQRHIPISIFGFETDSLDAVSNHEIDAAAVTPTAAGFRYESDLLAYAVEQAWKAGIVVVVSAGNEGEKSRGLTSPGYDPFVLTVGADSVKP